MTEPPARPGYRPSVGPIPGTELGVVLAFPCELCGRWAKPEICVHGLAVTPCCRVHVNRALADVLYLHVVGLVNRPCRN